MTDTSIFDGICLTQTVNQNIAVRQRYILLGEAGWEAHVPCHMYASIPSIYMPNQNRTKVQKSCSGDFFWPETIRARHDSDIFKMSHVLVRGFFITVLCFVSGRGSSSKKTSGKAWQSWDHSWGSQNGDICSRKRRQARENDCGDRADAGASCHSWGKYQIIYTSMSSGWIAHKFTIITFIRRRLWRRYLVQLKNLLVPLQNQALGCHLYCLQPHSVKFRICFWHPQYIFKAGRVSDCRLWMRVWRSKEEMQTSGPKPWGRRFQSEGRNWSKKSWRLSIPGKLPVRLAVKQLTEVVMCIFFFEVVPTQIKKG